MKNINILKLVTHWKGFHADDVMAGALLSYFLVTKKHLYDGYSFERVDYNKYTGSELISIFGNNTTDVMVYDVGRVYNPDSGLFDHHQYTSLEDNRASAGMVLDYLVDRGHIDSNLESSLRPLVSKIDDNDIGVKAAEVGDFSWVVRMLNIDNDSDEKDHLIRYEKAVTLAVDIISKLDTNNEKYIETCRLIPDSSFAVSDGFPDNDIIILPEYLPGWAKCINALAEDNPVLNKIDVAVWYNKKDNTWSAQTLQVSPSDYTKKGRSIRCLDQLPEDIIFVHKAEFFMVAKTKDSLMYYLHNNLYYA